MSHLYKNRNVSLGLLYHASDVAISVT